MTQNIKLHYRDEISEIQTKENSAGLTIQFLLQINRQVKKREGERENLQISGSQPGMTLPPGGIWQGLETLFGCHYWGGCATSTQWAEARAITEHLAICTGQSETMTQTKET